MNQVVYSWSTSPFWCWDRSIILKVGKCCPRPSPPSSLSKAPLALFFAKKSRKFTLIKVATRGYFCGGFGITLPLLFQSLPPEYYDLNVRIAYWASAVHSSPQLWKRFLRQIPQRPRALLPPPPLYPQKVCQLYFPRDFLHNMYEGRNLSCLAFFMIYWCSLYYTPGKFFKNHF